MEARTEKVPGMKDRVMVQWQLPPAKVVKLNTDGAVSKGFGRATAGGVLRNHKGDWLLGYTKDLGICSVDQAELYAMYEDLKLAWERGFVDLIVESDSSEALRMIETGSKRQSSNALVRGIVKLRSRSWNVTFRKIYREMNSLADMLAKPASKDDFSTCLLSVVPSSCFKVYHEDKLGLCRPRMVSATAKVLSVA